MSTARSLLNRFPEAVFVLLMIAVGLALSTKSNIAFRKFEVLLIPTLVLAGIWLWYVKRRIALLSDLAYYPLMLFLSGIAGLVLSYLVVDPGVPVYDNALAKMDSMLFFRWPDWLAFYRAHPWYQGVLQSAYDSWGLQIYGSAFFFAFKGWQSRNRELLRIAIASTVITLAVFHSLPALGPFFYYSVAPKLEPLLHLPYLRAGTALTLTPLDLQGLISFPSFHTVMAITFVYVHRGQGNLTRIIAVLNATMLLATIVCGAHYLVDLLGGLAVAAVSIAFVRVTMAVRSESPPASPVQIGSGSRQA